MGELANLQEHMMRRVFLEDGSEMEVNLKQKSIRGLTGEALRLCPYVKRYEECKAQIGNPCTVVLEDGSFFRTKGSVSTITDSPHHYQHYKTANSFYTINMDTGELTSPDLAKSLGVTAVGVDKIRFLQPEPSVMILEATLIDGRTWHTSPLVEVSKVMGSAYEEKFTAFQQHKEEEYIRE